MVGLRTIRLVLGCLLLAPTYALCAEGDAMHRPGTTNGSVLDSYIDREKSDQKPTRLASNTSMTASVHMDSVAPISNDLLLKEIELERYYIQYRLYAKKDPRFRELRYFAMQESDAALLLASNIINTVETGKGLRKLDKINPGAFRHSSQIGLVAVTLGGASSSVELGSNCLTAIRNKFIHKDPDTALKNVLDRVSEIDKLAAQRDALVEQCEDGPEKRLLQDEGKLLRHFRDWCVYEFADVYADAKSLQPSYSVFYAFDITGNALSVASYILALKAFKKPYLNGTSSKVGMISDSFFIVSGPVSTIAYNFLYKRAYNRVSKKLQEKLYDPESATKEDMERILSAQASAATTTTGLENRMRAYRLWAERYDQYAEDKKPQDIRAAKIALQNNISGPAISGAFLMQDVMNTSAFYRLSEKPKAQNALAFTGAVATCTASTASVFLTAQSLVSERLYRRKLARKNQLPEQLLERRLKTLDDVQKVGFPQLSAPSK